MSIFGNFPEQTPVLFKPYPSARQESQGIVIKNCGGGVAAILVYQYTGSGFQFEVKDNCYHIDDPRVAKFSPEFWEDEAGVFRLAPLAQSIDNAISELQQKVGVLTGEIQPPIEKRGRGRPTKAETEARRAMEQANGSGDEDDTEDISE